MTKIITPEPPTYLPPRNVFNLKRKMVMMMEKLSIRQQMMEWSNVVKCCAEEEEDYFP